MGCPPPKDPDGDGFIGDADACPLKAETVNGFEDQDGCPDELPDTDKDGILDATDACPEKPEDFDKFEDEDGCPEDDNDSDGVLDVTDHCPVNSGPPENHGCPDTDRDEDTVVDRLDNCPDEKGLVELQGCKKKQLVVITANQIDILEKVYFQTNKAIIRRRSYAVLNNVADVLKNHPELKLQVAGHTDDRGQDEANLLLSQRRAESAVRYLVARGVAEGRLTAQGFGEQAPAAPGTSKSARDSNRRVEFKIVNTPATP